MQPLGLQHFTWVVPSSHPPPRTGNHPPGGEFTGALKGHCSLANLAKTFSLILAAASHPAGREELCSGPLHPPSPSAFSIYLSPSALAAPHPRQRRGLLLPASPGCVERGGEAQKGKEKERGCCSCCCWAPNSGTRLQSLSGQVPEPCDHLGHPGSREEAKSERSKPPLSPV